MNEELKNAGEFALNNWEYIAPIVYEGIVRSVPTKRNLSILDLVFKILSIVIKNRRKKDSRDETPSDLSNINKIVVDRTKHIVYILMLISLTGFAQTNSTYKAARSYNADSLTVKTEVTGLVSMYNKVGAMYYNVQSNKWRVFSNGVWMDLFGSSGGGGGLTSANNGLNVVGGVVKLGGEILVNTNIDGAFNLGVGLITPLTNIEFYGSNKFDAYSENEMNLYSEGNAQLGSDTQLSIEGGDAVYISAGQSSMALETTGIDANSNANPLTLRSENGSEQSKLELNPLSAALTAIGDINLTSNGTTQHYADGRMIISTDSTILLTASEGMNINSDGNIITNTTANVSTTANQITATAGASFIQLDESSLTESPITSYTLTTANANINADIGLGVHISGNDGTAGQALMSNGTGGVIWATPSGGGSGTVTTVSVATANGFSGTVATPSTTPVITLVVPAVGMLKSNGTAIGAAVSGTDFQAPISLTTTGTSGAATFVANVLNVPNYASGGGGITNTAANNEMAKSNGTNIVPSGIESTTTGNLTLGLSATADASRIIGTNGIGGNNDIILKPEGNVVLSSENASSYTVQIGETSLAGSRQILTRGSGVNADLTIATQGATSNLSLWPGQLLQPVHFSAPTTTSFKLLPNQTSGATNGISVLITGGPAQSSTGLNGGDIIITSGQGQTASKDGDIILDPSTAGTNNGFIIFRDLPTSAVGLPSGALWNNAGVLSIAP